MEYKYRLDKGEALLYSWKATAPVNYEFHAEPDGAPRGYAQTYEKEDEKQQASGTLTAPFSGIHGWYWENTTDQEVTVTLTTAGYYNLVARVPHRSSRSRTRTSSVTKFTKISQGHEDFVIGLTRRNGAPEDNGMPRRGAAAPWPSWLRG